MDGKSDSVKPFQFGSQGVSPPELPRSSPFSEALTTWIEGKDDEAIEAARQTLWSALTASIWTDSRPPGLDTAHSQLLSVLASTPSREHSLRVIDLLIACRAGNPSQGSQLLLEYRKIALSHPEAATGDSAIFHAFGELADWDNAEVRELLKKVAASSAHALRIEAFSALVKCAIRSSFMAQANRKKGARVVQVALGYVPSDSFSRCAALMIALSELSVGEFSSPWRTRSLLVEVRDALITALVPYGFWGIFDPICNQLDAWDLVGACVLMAERLSQMKRAEDGDRFVRLAVSGLLVHRPDRHGWHSVAIAHMRAGDLPRAVQWAQHLIERLPEMPKYQVLRVELLRRQGLRGAALDAECSRVEKLYHLEEEYRRALDEIRKMGLSTPSQDDR